MMRWWKSYQRWKEADDKFWKMLGKFVYGSEDKNSNEYRRKLRYANRLYRLTRDRKNRAKLLGA